MVRRYAVRALSSAVLVVLCSCIAASDESEPTGKVSSAYVTSPTTGGPSNSYTTYATTSLVTAYSYNATAGAPLTTASQVAPYLSGAATNWNCGYATSGVNLATSSTGYVAPDGYAYQDNYYQWFQTCLVFWNYERQAAFVVPSVDTAYTSGQLYSKWAALNWDQGTLGPPISNPVPYGWAGVTYQLFRNGIITYASSYGAHYAGGPAPADRAIAEGLEKALGLGPHASGSPPTYALTSDPTCANLSNVQNAYPNPETCGIGQIGRFVTGFDAYWGDTFYVLARSGATSTSVVWGPVVSEIFAAYPGYEVWNTPLGFPQSPLDGYTFDAHGNMLSRQDFEHGAVTWEPNGSSQTCAYAPNSHCPNGSSCCTLYGSRSTNYLATLRHPCDVSCTSASKPGDACDALSNGQWTSSTCGAAACNTQCTYGSSSYAYCYDTTNSANSTCQKYGVFQGTSSCLLQPTQPGCTPLNQAHGWAATYGTCNDGTVFPVVSTSGKGWSQLAGPRTTAGTAQYDINVLMNDAAALIGCNYNVDANATQDAYLSGSYTKQYGTSSNAANGCGEVFFNGDFGCAFPLSNTASPPGPLSQHIATAPQILARWGNFNDDAGVLGRPTSFPVTEAPGVSWQRFTSGYITYRAPDAQAVMIGGNGVGLATKAYNAAAAYGRDFDTVGSAPNDKPLASAQGFTADGFCLNPTTPGSCGTGFAGNRWWTYPPVTGGPNSSFIWATQADQAFEVSGAIGKKYFTLGAYPETSWLGFPVDAEKPGPPGSNYTYQAFKAGNVYHQGSSSFFVDTNLLGAYTALGGPASSMGLPVEDAPSPGVITASRAQHFAGGSIVVTPGLWYPLPPAPNPSGPTQFYLQGIQNNPDGTTTYLPDSVGSSNTIGLAWFNNDTSAGSSTTIYRQVTDMNGNCTPNCAYQPVATVGTVSYGPNTWTDTNATPNALNCYFVRDVNGAGQSADSPDMCAYTLDGNKIHPARVQLSLTVGPNYQNMTLDPVFVRLQGPTWLPRGNISWLMKDTPYLVYGKTTTFDLYTNKTIHDLSEITEINLGVSGWDDLCITNMTLLVDWGGDPSGSYNVAYYQDFSGQSGGCATVVGSDGNGYGGTQITVGFQQLRQSPDWSYQVSQHLSQMSAGAPTFLGYFDGNATRGAIMGLAQNSLFAKGIQMRVDHPIDLGVHGNAVRNNNILSLTTHVHKYCDAYAGLDIRLVNHCGCDANGNNVITDTEVVLENAQADVEPGSLCSVGADVLAELTHLFTLGYYDFGDWLYDDLTNLVMKAIAGKGDASLPRAPPPGSQFGFQTASTTYGGFGIVPGQVCDTYDTSCTCATTSAAGYCEPN